MEKQKPKRRFDDTQLQLIKTYFADNEDLCIAIRKALLGGDLTKAQDEMLKPIRANSELVALLKQAIVPDFNLDAPLTQVVDLFVGFKPSLGFKDECVNEFEKREAVDLYLGEAFANFAAGEPMKYPKYADSDDSFENAMWQMVRYDILTQIDVMLQHFMILGGKKEESVEDTIKRLDKMRQNSSK